MDDSQRKALLNKVKQACKANSIDEESYPITWEDRALIQVPVIPTPSSRLNAALGIGGIPLGRVTEIYGTESSGKTTIMLQVMAKAQKMGMNVAFIDMEHSLDASYAAALGVNMNEVLISQPKDGDTAMQLIRALLMTGEIGLIVLDSIPAMVSKEEFEKDVTSPHVAMQARMMSQGLRQFTPLLSKSQTAVVFINQIREKVGVMYGNPETTPGGRSMKFYASIRIDMRAQSAKDEKRRTSKIKVVKNKLAPPCKWCEVDIIYGKGFDTLKDTVMYAKDLGIIEGRSWMTLPQLDCPGLEGYNFEENELKFQGINNVMDFVQNTEGYLDALADECQKTMKELNNGSREEQPGDATADLLGTSN